MRRKVNEKKKMFCKNRKGRTAQKSEGTILLKTEVQSRVHCFQWHLAFSVIYVTQEISGRISVRLHCSSLKLVICAFFNILGLV